ncbi:hypothetical protein OPKNFCMD_4519 [Methylobacterium crusticola]|uniref:Uncharacterized protein n=1 Tax=Methylobacterium crusticola TaxID=1697972 RepID=A0ABQ4R3A5_9HYPH|nr:hypothetical protein [Methylobacterium crusticola]GJD51761.1 hypothetical protein OPKNFCMD_4519 [Methylobacterium crusticola]
MSVTPFAKRKPMPVPAKLTSASTALVVSPVDRLRTELVESENERADAARVRIDLEAGLPDVIAQNDEEALARHERAADAARRRLDLAEARVAKLTLAVRDAEHQAEQERRQGVYDEAKRALKQARQIMAAEYEPAARAVADVLNRVSKLRAQIYTANQALPADAEPLSLMVEPAFNGEHFTDGSDEMVEQTFLVDKATGQYAPYAAGPGPSFEYRTRMVKRSLPIHPARPHKAIADFVNLPGIDDTYIFAAPFWGQPRA